jgi:hypothetical protein
VFCNDEAMRNRRRHLRTTAIAMLGLALAACSGDDDDVATTTTAPTAETGAAVVDDTAVDDTAVDGAVDTTVAPATTTTGPDPTTGTTSTPTTSTTQLATSWLRDGAFADQTFGAGTLDAAVAIASDELGEPADDTVIDCDGGSSRQVHWEVLTLSGDPATGAVTGWYYEGGEPSLLGPLGIGIGTTVAELRALVPTIEVFEATLGPEFAWTSDNDQIVGGFLTGLDDDDTVIAFHAGFVCAFR